MRSTSQATQLSGLDKHHRTLHISIAVSLESLEGRSEVKESSVDEWRVGWRSPRQRS